MKTPAEYNNNLNKGIATTEMLCDALFSVNKRAKNYRDQKRKYRSCGYDKYSYAEKSEEKEEELYKLKENLLTLLSPVCIHKEFLGYERVRVYEYQKNFKNLYFVKKLENKIVWWDTYYDYDRYNEVYFFDYATDKAKYNYYLYYVCGDRSFHTPIDSESIDFYKSKYNIDICNIGALDTHGKDIDDLISLQFARRLSEEILAGKITYVKTQEDTCGKEQKHSTGPIHLKELKVTEDSVRDVISEFSGAIAEHIKHLTMICSPEESAYIPQIRQKAKKSKKKVVWYGEPKISRPKLSLDECSVFSDEMIGFVTERTSELLNSCEDKENYPGIKEAFYQIFADKESPCYKQILKAVSEWNRDNKLCDEYLQAAKKLYGQKPGEKIEIQKLMETEKPLI